MENLENSALHIGLCRRTGSWRRAGCNRRKITALGFLSTAMDWGFDTIHLNLKVINLALALQFHISVGQIIMIVVCIFTAPKIVGKLTS